MRGIKHMMIILAVLLTSVTAHCKTLVVYYSYTGNCREIVNTLTQQISADVLEIQPSEDGVKYDANNYAIGDQLIAAINANPNDASSYPGIKTVSTNLADYSTIIIATPLWWSHMAAIMQSYLFSYGSQMAGKNIGLIVSSWSSGISTVVSDCKRLVPDGNYFSENLWINHNNQSNRATLIENWLTAVNYNAVTGISSIKKDNPERSKLYNINGQRIAAVPSHGLYIENGKKKVK